MTRQVFIHTNTETLRAKLTRSGIKVAENAAENKRSYGLLFNGKTVIGISERLEEMGTIHEYLKDNKDKILDCGNNEELFLQKTIESKK